MRAFTRWQKGSRSVGQPGTGSRLALIALLVLLMVVGLHAEVSAPVWDRHSKLYDTVVVGALETVVIVALLAVLVRGHRAPPDQLLAAKVRTALRYLLVVGVLVLAVTLVMLVVDIHLPSAQPGRAPGAVTRGHAAPLPTPKLSARSSQFPLSEILYGLVAAILLAAIVALSLRVVRRGRRLPPPEPELPAQEYGSALQEALLWGQRALLELDDARAAIIACYVAMEESLARVGTARLSTETPDELLVRASRTLLISATAATRLTSLFYEARFSSHPMDGAQRDAAERALAELASQLDHAQPVPAGGLLS